MYDKHRKRPMRHRPDPKCRECKAVGVVSYDGLCLRCDTRIRKAAPRMLEALRSVADDYDDCLLNAVGGMDLLAELRAITAEIEGE